MFVVNASMLMRDEKASRSCCRVHADVGCGVTLTCRMRRRSWAKTTKTNMHTIVSSSSSASGLKGTNELVELEIVEIGDGPQRHRVARPMTDLKAAERPGVDQRASGVRR